jgi:hypothetical protein
VLPQQVAEDLDRPLVEVDEAEVPVERVERVGDAGEDRVDPPAVVRDLLLRAPALAQVPGDRRQRERLAGVRIVDPEGVP